MADNAQTHTHAHYHRPCTFSSFVAVVVFSFTHLHIRIHTQVGICLLIGDSDTVGIAAESYLIKNSAVTLKPNL